MGGQFGVNLGANLGSNLGVWRVNFGGPWGVNLGGPRVSPRGPPPGRPGPRARKNAKFCKLLKIAFFSVFRVTRFHTKTPKMKMSHFVPTGRVIKYPPKCAPPAPAGPKIGGPGTPKSGVKNTPFFGPPGYPPYTPPNWPQK